MVLGIQIIGILFGVFMLYYTFLYYKRKEFRQLEFGFWVVLWGVLIAMAIWPNSLDFLVKKVLSLSRPLDFFMIVGFLFIVFLAYFNYISSKKINHKIDRIISAAAINKAETEEHKEKEPK